jgi:hypothetical protein
MVLIRRLTTDQRHLARCVADKRRLRELIRAARRRRDKPAVRRHKAIRTAVQLKLLRAEGWPLLLSVPVIAFLGTWGYYRLAHHPPAPHEPVALELSLPPSAVGSLATLVPEEGLEANGWIARVAAGEADPPHGVARWTVRGDGRPEPYRLRMRFRGRTFEHPFRVGEPVYARPVRQHEPGLLLPQSVLYMRPRKVLGLIPWWPPTTTVGTIFPAWLVSYVLLVIPLVYLLKRIARVH